MKKFTLSNLLTSLFMAALTVLLSACGGGSDPVATAATATTPATTATTATTATAATTATTATTAAATSTLGTDMLGNWLSPCGGIVGNGTFSMTFVANADGTRTSTTVETRYSGANCTGTVTATTTQTNRITLGSVVSIGGTTAMRYTYTPVSGPVTRGGLAIFTIQGTPAQFFEGTGSLDADGYPTQIATAATGTKQ
jgi:hypothetical protein